MHDYMIKHVLGLSRSRKDSAHVKQMSKLPHPYATVRLWTRPWHRRRNVSTRDHTRHDMLRLGLDIFWLTCDC